MSIKKLAAMSVLFFGMIFVFSLTAAADELEYGIFTYEVIGDSAYITSCSDRYRYKIIIPEKAGEYTVRGISSGAFYGNEYLTELVISEGIESIGGYAFYMCSKLEEVTLPEGVTEIGENAFGQCERLGEIFLPDSVQSIGENAFSSSSKITVSEANERFSSDENGVLFNKYGSLLLQYPSNSNLKEFDIPPTVKKIAKRAFYGSKNLEKISFPNGLTTVGEEAFLESSVKEIALPESVKKIEKSAFSVCPITKAVLSDAVTDIPERLFYMCTLLESVETGKDVKSIGDGAFFGCERLSGFEIPSGVRSIGRSAFFGCRSLLKISVPSGVESIPDNAFYSSGLCEITLPSSLKSIGYEAFAQCDSLKRVVVNAPKSVFDEVFIDRHNEAVTESEKIFRDYDINFSIREPSSKSVRYGEILVLYADTDTIPENSRIVWTADEDCAKLQQSADGTACHVIPIKSGKVTVSAYLSDGSGRIAVNSKGERVEAKKTIRVRVNIFARAVSRIKNLFNLTKYVF